MAQPPDKLWSDNPFIKGRMVRAEDGSLVHSSFYGNGQGVSDLSYMLNVHPQIQSGEYANRAVAAKAQFMDPGMADAYQAWATHHPTVDPRTWAPLADRMIFPDDEAGELIAGEDIYGQVASGEYGRVAGEKPEVPATPQQAPAASPVEEDSGGLFGWFGDNFERGANMASAVTPDFVGSALETGFEAEKAYVRGVGTVLSAPAQYALGAEPRTNEGNKQAVLDLLPKYGLEDNETNRNYVEQGLDPRLADAMRLPDDQVAAITEAHQEFADTRPDTGREKIANNWMQTELGQTAASFTDDQPGNLMKQTFAEGSVRNDKGEWVNPQTGEPAKVTPEQGWLPNPVGQAKAEDVALKTYNITSPDEMARGIRPVPWTFGRQVAHIWYEPDSTAFNAVSGSVDFGVNLGLDPVNLIPMGAASKAFKGLTPAARAFRLTDDVAVVAAPTFAGSGGLKGARATAVGATVARQVDDAAPMLLDPAFAERGAVVKGRAVQQAFDAETGLVNVPHGKYVVNQNAWSWLNRGRGARVVDELTNTVSPTTIMERSGNKMDANLAIELADASSSSQVRAILATRMGYDLADPTELGKLGKGGPSLSRVPLWTGIRNPFTVAGTELAGGGVLTKAGRQATAYNLEEFGWMGAVRGMYRRPFRMAPRSGNGFDLESADDTYREWNNFARGVRMDEKARIDASDQILRAGNGVQRYDALYGDNGALAKVVKGSLLDRGIEEGDAKKLTRAFAGGIDPEMRRTLNQDLSYGTLGTQTEDGSVGRALLLGEMLSRNAHLPDYRALSRTTSAIGNIRKSGLAGADEFVTDALHEFTSAWRSAVLMRPAYTLREIGELAWSMSLAGTKGAFTHPVAFIGNMMHVAASMDTASKTATAFKKVAGLPMNGRSLVVDKIGRMMMQETDGSLRKLTSAELKTAMDGLDRKAVREWAHTQTGLAGLLPHLDQRWARVNGEGMFDELNAFNETDDAQHLSEMFQQLNGVVGNMVVDEAAGRKAAQHLRALPRDDPQFANEYLDAFVEKLSLLGRDRLMKDLADPQLTKEQVFTRWNGTGTKSLQAIMRKDLLDGTPRKDMEYVEGYENILQQLTFGDSRLLDAVLDNSFDGKPLNSKNRALKNLLAEFKEDDIKKVLMPDVLHDVPYDRTLVGMYKNVTDNFFAATGDFSDLFARGPFIREKYVERVTQLAPAWTPAAKAEVVAALRKAGDYDLAKQVLRTRATKNGTLGIEEVDAIASGYARKEAAKAFYDAHRRQNYALAIRIAMPFAQATFNTFRRWGEMSWQRPQMLYRTMKPIEALTDPGSAALYDIIGNVTGDEGMQALYSSNHPEASVNGFFFTNQYGDRQFAYPLVGRLAQLLPFIHAPQGTLAIANAEGLNVAGVSANPGMGPLVTAGAALMTGTAIHQDNLLGAILRASFPYGLPEGSVFEKLIYSASPTAIRKMGQATDPEVIANNTMRATAILIGTGDYDLSKRAELRRLTDDARSLSVRLATASAFFGMVTPSTFSWQTAVAIDGDPTGAGRNLMLQDRLMQEFRKYTAAQSPETSQEDYSKGFMQFVEDYGQTALFSVLPMTKSANENADLVSTLDVWSWRSENPQSYRAHQPVIGLFFPGGDPVTDFSENLYRWQKATGERVPKTPDEFVMDVNSQLGWMLYVQSSKQVMKHVSDPDQISLLNAQNAAELERKYPGFIREQSNPKEFQTKILEVTEAAKNPQIETLPGTPFISAYLKARRNSIDELQDAGEVGTLSADYATEQRERLLRMASSFVRRDTSGTFINAWTRLFADEFGLEE